MLSRGLTRSSGQAVLAPREDSVKARSQTHLGDVQTRRTALLLALLGIGLAHCTGGDDSAGAAGGAASATPFGIGPFNNPAQPLLTGTTAACPDVAFACEVFTRVNEERVAVGRRPLSYNSELARAAQAHANDMRQQDYFSHSSLDGRSFSDRVGETSYTGAPRGENIAQGQRTPEEVMSSWMNSSGHRQNILSDGSSELGVGHVDGYWVQVFGRSSN